MDDSFDVKRLRMFVTTVKEGSMRRASALLFVTPSALSHGIRTLEQSLDTKLFDRRGPILETTAAGQQFFNEASDIVSRLDGVVARFSAETATAHPQLHIGKTPTGCRYLFPGIVREFRESFPDVALKLEIGDTDQLIERMSERKIDIMIAPVQRDYQWLEHVELGHDELVYIVHPSHPWAKLNRVDQATLADQQLITPAVQSHTYNLIDGCYREMRLPLDPFIELNNEEATKQLVSLNIGVGIVPRWIAQEEIESGALFAFSLREASLMRRWTLSHRSNTTPSFAEFLFLGITQAVARKLIGGGSGKTD